MITPWQVRLLGALYAERGNEKIARFRSQKTAALFAYLCLHARHGREHGREELADLFWPDDERDAGRNNLRVALSFLRKALEPAPCPVGTVLISSRTHVRLRPETIRTDVDEFEAALKRGDDQWALAIYESGPFLPGIYEEWALTERERLEALADDTRYRRQSAAPGKARETIGTAVSAPPFPNNLPAMSDRFFGREEEEARLEMLLLNPAVSLITVTGPGGAGKTRLAVEASHRLFLEKTGGGATSRAHPGRFAGGIWLVPLAALSDPAALTSVLPLCLREAMGLRAEAGREPLTQVADTLADRPALFVLDNLEQVADGAISALSLVMARLPQVTLLVTSRVRMGLKGERVVAVGPLPLPEQDADLQTLARNEAALLFADRARAVETDFTLTTANTGEIGQLLSLLEGLPLAIELAAAWANVLTPRQMREQLETRLNSLPVRRAGDRTSRHSSLSAAFRWSYDLLEPGTRRLLARLSVFRGGFPADAAAAVCLDDGAANPDVALPALARLHQYSLLTTWVTEDRAAAAVRFSLPESLREFADACLDDAERDEMARRHGAFYLDKAETAKRRQGTPEATCALDALEPERDNLRAATERAMTPQSLETALRLAAAQQWLWIMRGPLAEGRRLLEKALAIPAPEATTASRADAMNALGGMAYFQANYSEARGLFEQCLALCRRLAYPGGTLVALSNLGTVLMECGERDPAEPLFEEALILARKRADRAREASVLFNLGNLAHWRHDMSRAMMFHEEALAARREIGDARGVSLSVTSLGILAMERGDFSRARECFHDGLRLHREMGDRFRTAVALDNLARAEEGLGRPDEAVLLRGAADATRRELNAPLSPERQEVWDVEHTRLRACLSADAFALAWKAGASQTWEEAIAHALSGNG